MSKYIPIFGSISVDTEILPPPNSQMMLAHGHFSAEDLFQIIQTKLALFLSFYCLIPQTA
ncbi:MAG: hypothetical protein Q9165_005900, partial [Trypethelium subeluteriae]